MFENKQINNCINIDKEKISCPPKNLKIWQNHPMVYLTLNRKIPTICPYCGAKYKLINKN